MYYHILQNPPTSHRCQYKKGRHQICRMRQPAMLGFTLLELLVGIAVIGLLASIALAGSNILRDRARIAGARQFSSSIKNMMLPVAEWNFEEPSGNIAYDSSGTKNDGTLINSPARVANNVLGGTALQFDRLVSKYVAVPNSPSLNPTTAFTIEAWVKPTTLSSWRTIILKEKTTSLAYALYANTDTGKPSAEMYGTSALAGTTQLPLNTWTHIAATYDGTTLKLYINGSMVSSKSTSITIRISLDPLRIGGNTKWGEYFNGLIDEVRIYNRALTNLEIENDRDTPL